MVSSPYGLRQPEGSAEASATSGRIPATFLFFPSRLPVASQQQHAARPTASTSSPTRHYVYGWESSQVAVVAGVVEARSRSEAEGRLQEAAQQLTGMTEQGSLGVLGLVHHGDEAVLPEAELNVKDKGKGKAVKSLPFIMVSNDGVPAMIDLPSSHHPTVVMYNPPSRTQLQFFSLTPLQLDLNSFSLPSSSATGAMGLKDADALGDDDPESAVLQEKLLRLVELDFTRHPLTDVADLGQAIDWINLSPNLTNLIAPPRPPAPFRPPFLSSSFLHHANTSLKHPLRILQLTAQSFVLLANWQLPFLNGTAPKDFSATIQQIDTRLSQGLSWPYQYSLIQQRLENAKPVSEASHVALGCAHYIQFYNTLWLIANDIIVGSAFTSFVCENNEYLGHALGDAVQSLTLDSLREQLLWLNDWPGGVKLNFELATIFCDAFLWGTKIWEDLIFTPLRPHLPALLYIWGLSGLLGTTMFISMAQDILAVLVLHLYVFYVMATSVFRWHLTMLGSLFNIFRGKKYNVLRSRVEPAVYEVDQLLLGTILFTLAAFLFPTVVAYYSAFAACRLAIVVLHAAMETVVAFMNHFPLFAVMLRLKDPRRLPGGLQFELKHSGGREDVPYLCLKNNPLHLSGIFFQHVQLSRRLASHYSPIFLLGKLFSGRQISPIPRVRLRLWADVEPPKHVGVAKPSS